jgi:hypothetical protein
VPSRRKAEDSRTIQLTIDRIETGKGGPETEIAVLLTDDGTQVNVPRNLLPKAARPGDVLAVTIRRDPEATRKVAEESRKVQDELKTTDPGGDIQL